MSKTKVTPLGDRVLVNPEEGDEKKTASGIIIPDTAKKEKPKQGKVIALGELKEIQDIAVGDTVFFSEYGHDEIKVDGDTLYLVKSKDLLAVIK